MLRDIPSEERIIRWTPRWQVKAHEPTAGYIHKISLYI